MSRFKAVQVYRLKGIRVRLHLIVRLRSFWIDAHYSCYNNRLCVNVLPGITVALTFPGGLTPDTTEFKRMWRLW